MSAANTARRTSSSVGPLIAIITATVLSAGYMGGSWLPGKFAGKLHYNPAERAFAPVSQPWHVKDEKDATHGDRVARYKYLYKDQKTGNVMEAPSAISTEVHPIKKLPEQLSGTYPHERYDGDH